MVSRRTRVASWIFRRDHPSRPKAMICCFFSSFKTFAMLREATYPPAAVNVLDVFSESMAAFQVFTDAILGPIRVQLARSKNSLKDQERVSVPLKSNKLYVVSALSRHFWEFF